MQAAVDYGLAKRAVLRAYRSGHVARPDICDAHPDLLRAANYSGRSVAAPCPVCEGPDLRLVTYVFSDEFSKRENGRVWSDPDLAGLLAYREVRVYTVEVCVDCAWNHLRSQVGVGHGDVRRGREASK